MDLSHIPLNAVVLSGCCNGGPRGIFDMDKERTVHYFLRKHAAHIGELNPPVECVGVNVDIAIPSAVTAF
jgi:hypothetical protein